MAFEGGVGRRGFAAELLGSHCWVFPVLVFGF